MELDWTTMVLEIINFLVLVWLLKHFLYAPVLRVIGARREAIEQDLQEAQQREARGQQLRDEYEHRMAEWQRERDTAREKLEHELHERRALALEELRTSLDEERERAGTLRERELHDRDAAREREALALAGRFASELLETAAGPDVEARLIEHFCTELPSLGADDRVALQRSADREGRPLEVTSAFALSDAQQERLRACIHEFLDIDGDIVFRQNSELLAGIRLSVGDWSLDANLRDELRFFAAQAQASD